LSALPSKQAYSSATTLTKKQLLWKKFEGIGHRLPFIILTLFFFTARRPRHETAYITGASYAACRCQLLNE